ncbi:MAG: acyl-CoA dehydrogenase family protein [Thermoplasmata archaeon]|nr:acyl-CoA dehydrogenase family protein [Thermoplasmata archaeon]
MHGSLPSTTEGWRARARSFADRRLAPIAEAVDRDDALPPTIRAELAEGGFFGLGLPPNWGGSGGDTRATVAVLEELAVQSPAVAVLLAVHLSVSAAPVLKWGSDDQRERFVRPMAQGRLLGAFALTEPSVGSDAARLSARYRAEGTGFVLNGAKMFITNGGSADVVLLFATRDPQEGHRGITAFMIPKGTPGFSVAQHLDKLGLRGSETTELVLEEVRLGPEHRVGPEGSGFRVAMEALVGGRVGIAACALGVARGAFEEMQLHAGARPEDWKRSCVARAFTHLSAARALVDVAAERKDAGASYENEASCAKLFASKAAVEIASRGLDVAGRAELRAWSRPERLFRDARVFPIVEGTTEIQELILGRSLVRDPSEPRAG